MRKQLIKNTNIKSNPITDYEFVQMLTHFNKFESQLLMQQIAAGKKINGDYFLNKNKKKVIQEEVAEDEKV